MVNRRRSADCLVGRQEEGHLKEACQRQEEAFELGERKRWVAKGGYFGREIKRVSRIGH